MSPKNFNNIVIPAILNRKVEGDSSFKYDHFVQAVNLNPKMRELVELIIKN